MPTPGLIPGANTSGSSMLTLPFAAPQQGGQASLGGAINPLLPINTSTSTAYPMMPQGAVSNSATTGFPAVPATTNTGGFSANAGGVTSAPIGTGTGGGLPGIGQSLTQQQALHLKQGLDHTYGKGVGDLIVNFLQGGAGYNTQAINNMIAQLQPTFRNQQQNLLQQFSAGGNRFGSGAQVGYADLLSQQGLEVGSIEAQMYESAINNFMSVLMGSGGANAQRKASSPSVLDQIGAALGLVGAGAKGLGAAGVGGSSGGLSSALSGLAVL